MGGKEEDAPISDLFALTSEWFDLKSRSLKSQAEGRIWIPAADIFAPDFRKS
jgi:hypothetical protein